MKTAEPFSLGVRTTAIRDLLLVTGVEHKLVVDGFQELVQVREHSSKTFSKIHSLNEQG